MRQSLLLITSLLLALAVACDPPTVAVDDSELFGAYTLLPPMQSGEVVTGHLILSKGRIYESVTRDPRLGTAGTFERGGYLFTRTADGYDLTFHPSGVLDNPLNGTQAGGTVRFTRDGIHYVWERMQ